MQCQGAIASGSVYLPVRLGGRSATSVLPLCSPHCAGCLCCSPLVAVLWDFLAPVACLCLGGAMLMQCMSSWRLLGAVVRSCVCCMVVIFAFYARWHQLCGSCRCARLVRPISTALTGRETNGGNPMVLAAAAGHGYHTLWRVQLVKQLERRLLTGAQRVLCSGGSWGFGGLPQ